MVNIKLSDDQIKNCIVGDIPVGYTPPSWDVWLMKQVYLVASKSKDNSTKIGAIIVKNNRVLSVGFNGLPTGVDDAPTDRNIRPNKYMWFEHGERNAIYSAARYGIETNDALIFTQAIPCCDCGRAIIQSGIKEVVIHGPFEDILHSIRDHWNESCFVSETMFKESGIKVRRINELIGVEGFVSGKIINV
jgi:dCMP deaminase